MIVVMITILSNSANLFPPKVGIAHMIMKDGIFALVIFAPDVLNIMINARNTSPDIVLSVTTRNTYPFYQSGWVKGNKLLFVFVTNAQHKAIKLVSKEVRA